MAEKLLHFVYSLEILAYNFVHLLAPVRFLSYVNASYDCPYHKQVVYYTIYSITTGAGGGGGGGGRGGLCGVVGSIDEAWECVVY